MPHERRTVTGRYVLVPNPCTTEPCLPGLAYAVETGAACYLLTVRGRWSAVEGDWGDARVEPGAVVTVTGMVSEQVDRRGDRFQTIEVEALSRARESPP